jgi:N-acetylglucosamine-6-phosphate deacetylase
VQINGAYGIDFSELNVDEPDGGESSYLAGLDHVAKRIVETGCTSFVPTIITQKEELYAKVTAIIDGAWQDADLAVIETLTTPPISFIRLKLGLPRRGTLSSSPAARST